MVQVRNFLKPRNLPFDYGEGTGLGKGTSSCPGLVPVWKELWLSLLGRVRGHPILQEQKGDQKVQELTVWKETRLDQQP